MRDVCLAMVCVALAACTHAPAAPMKKEAAQVCVEGSCPPPSLPPGVVVTPD